MRYMMQIRSDEQKNQGQAHADATGSRMGRRGGGPSAGRVRAGRSLTMSLSSRRRTGYVLTGLVILFLLFDSVGKLLRLRPMVEGTAALGYPDGAVRVIGAILLV